MRRSVPYFIGLFLQTLLFIPMAAQTDMATLKVLLANESNDEALALFRELVSVDGENAELWYLGAIAQRKLMRPDSSLIYLQTAASIDGEDERIASALAAAYTAFRQFSRAKDIYRDLIQKDSSRLDPYIQLASLHLRDSEPRLALDLYYLLHEREPDNYTFLKNIASCYRFLRNDPRAVSYYLKAHESGPEDLSINLALAELYLKMINYRGGLEIVERGLEVERTSNELLFWSGFFNYTLGFYSQAINRLHLAEKNGNESVNVKQYLGICYYMTRNYEKAREYLEIAILSNENNYRLFNYLGIIYREFGDFEISERYFFNSLAVLTPPVNSLTETYLHLAETYKLSGEMNKLAEAYKSALVYDGNNPYLHYGLAYTLDNQLSQKKSALEHYIRFSDLAVAFLETDGDMPSLLDHANSRIRMIREDAFFEQ